VESPHWQSWEDLEGDHIEMFCAFDGKEVTVNWNFALFVLTFNKARSGYTKGTLGSN